MNETLTKANNLLKDKPWIQGYFDSNFTDMYESTQSWLKEQMKEQAKIPLSQVNLLSLQAP